MPGLGKNIGDAYIEVHSDTGPFRRELRREARAAGAEAGEEFDRSLGPRLGRLDIGLRRLRGSRNDFLNIIGTISDSLERTFGNALRDSFEGVGALVAGLGRTIAQTDGPLSRFGDLLDRAGVSIARLGGGGIDGLIIQLGALLLSIGALVSVAGPLASGLSGIAAALAALTVGVGGALAGGILALGPALVAAAGGVAALTLAFSDLSDEQRAAFGPLNDLLSEVRSSVQEALFRNAGDQVGRLASALRPLGGLLTALAGEFSAWADDVLRAVGPNGRVAASLDTLGRSIPSLFRTVLDVIGNLSAGLTGLFAGATPGAQRLFDGINRVANAFAEWSNSVEGQTAINDFMNTAIDLLGDIWDLATQVGSVLSNIWEMGGAEAARQIIQDIANAFRQLNEYMEDPGNRQAVLDFFNNGVTVLRSLGPLLLSIINLFRALDTEFNRMAFEKVVNGITGVVNGITDLSVIAQGILINFDKFINKTVEVATGLGNLQARAAESGRNFRTSIVNAFDTVSDAVGPIVQRILSLRSPMEQAGEAGQRLRQRISDAFSRASADVARGATNVRSQLNSLATRAGEAANRAAGSLSRLAGNAGSALGRLASSVQSGISRALGYISRFPGQAANALGRLAGMLYSAGVNAIQGLYNGIVSRGQSVLNYLSTLASRAASTFARALGIASPSKVFRSFGEDIVDGLVQGIDGGQRAVDTSLNNLVTMPGISNLNVPASSLGSQDVGSPVFAGGGTSIAPGAIQIVTPFANPRLVAQEFLDALAARGK
jgi:hypothetical protein